MNIQMFVCFFLVLVILKTNVVAKRFSIIYVTYFQISSDDKNQQTTVPNAIDKKRFANIWI